MSRLLIRAILVAGVAAVALTQLDNEQELLAWELILLGVVIWEMRALPGSAEVVDPPLFDLSAREQRRLPRAVSSMELSVIDVVTGHLGPDRRLQPTLNRLAVHRLRRKGVEFDTPAAMKALGEEEWVWLADPSRDAPTIETLEAVVSRLEEL